MSSVVNDDQSGREIIIDPILVSSILYRTQISHHVIKLYINILRYKTVFSCLTNNINLT
jgi:hypothetical protein